MQRECRFSRALSFSNWAFNRLPQPPLNLALAIEQTALVYHPVLGRFPRELTMPLGDLGITSRAQGWRFPEASSTQPQLPHRKNDMPVDPNSSMLGTLLAVA